jgi:SHS2 domain-containing protein
MFRWVDHTSEVELEIEAASRQELFAEAVPAVTELLGSGDRSRPRSRDVTVRADDGAALFAAWLEELVFLAETEGFVPEAVETLELGDVELRARVRGRRGDPAHLVKGVTYHRLEVAIVDGAWIGRVVLDV